MQVNDLPGQTSGPRQTRPQTVLGLAARPVPSGTATTTDAGQTSGLQQPKRRRRTIIGLSAASITVRPRRQTATPTSRHTAGIRHSHRQTDFRRTALNLSTTDGPQSDAVTAAISAASGKSGGPSPTRRTSPVMTNKRVKSVLEPVRNTAVMAPPSADEHPAECPAALPQSLPLHPDPLFNLVPNAKTREAHKALRGFRSGCISPVDFVLMSQ